MMKALLLLMFNRRFVGVIALGVAMPVCAATIQEAFDNAIKVDPALRSSRFNQDASHENIAIARARLFPQISLQGSTNQLTQTFQIDPISIFLTESNDDKMKITSEIILNFDQIESESCLKRIEQEIENVKETFKIMIDNKKETVVEMHEQITSDEYSSEDETSQSSNVIQCIFLTN